MSNSLAPLRRCRIFCEGKRLTDDTASLGEYVCLVGLNPWPLAKVGYRRECLRHMFPIGAVGNHP